MSQLKKAINKFGGKNLVKQYLISHTLLYVCVAFFINGRDKTSLEIVRNGQKNKVKKKLSSRYSQLINKPLEKTVIGEVSNKIWFAWFQGIENAPEIVQVCYKQLLKNLPEGKEVILITKENMFDYAEFPDSIIKKWHSGIISHAHFSDLLRIELLLCHGGTWIDSTVLLSSNKFPKPFFNSELFFFQKLKPARDGNPTRMSSWFITSRSNEPILKRIQELLYLYWEKNNNIIDYFLFHVFMELVLDAHVEEQKKIAKYSSGQTHVMLLQINDTYNKQNFDNILESSPIHKLSYKGIKNNNNESYYKYLLKGEI